MSDHVDSEPWDSTGHDGPESGDGAASVEAYRTDGGVVFFDAENPLAWLEAASTVRLSERV